MNELLAELRDLSISGWMMIVCGLGVVLLMLRLALKNRKSGTQPEPEPERPSRVEDPGVFGSLTQALASQIPESEKEATEFGKLLRQAGLYSPAARSNVYAYRFLLMVFPLVCAGILAVAEPDNAWKYMIVGAFIAAALSIIPRLYVFMRRTSRLHEIRCGLSDMMDMLSMCLNGGMPLSASLDHVSRNLTHYPALAAEMQIMRRQSDVGSLRSALQDWANRVDLPEVRQVASLLSRGEQLGTGLSNSLMDQADHFRQTRKQLATLQANRMPVFMTLPLLFCFAPAVLILLMSPAFMQLTDFFTGNNALTDNDQLNLSPAQILESLESLDQDADGIRAATGNQVPSGE